jgi:hypothetical protein
MSHFVSFLLLNAVIAFCSYTLHAQSLREVFQRFPLKRPEASMTASPTNNVFYDADNGYLSIKTTPVAETETTMQTVFARYTADDGTKYYAYQEITESRANPCRRAFLKFYLLDADEWRDVTAQLLPSVRISEFYGQKSTPNLIDVNGIISYSPDDNKHGIGLGIDYVLPQKGTMITATLVHRCDTAIKPEYKTLLNDCKFKTIELLWNKQNGWFLMGKKR